MRVRAGRLRGVGIGAGYFSGFHYDAWNRVGGVEISAIADLDHGKAERVAERFGIPRVYADVREMLDEERPDFVDIITPPASHRSLCGAAAERGIDIICQKPLAPTLNEAEELVGATEAAGVRFLVHENWRWQPWYREIRSMLDEGTLGAAFSACFTLRLGDGWAEDAYLARQPYFREYPRLLMYETGVHFIDVFRYLLGEVTSVFARLRRLNPGIAGEDSGHVVLGFASGAMAILDANRYNEPETDDDPRYTFGTLRVDAAGGHLRLHPDGRLVVKRLGAPAYDHAYEHPRQGFAGDSILGLQRHFVERLRSGAPFESEGSDYLRTLRVVEACYASAAEGRVVHLDGDWRDSTDRGLTRRREDARAQPDAADAR
ncbi:MAG TPA: Gfo/Idh/MocA family oxidoreductase [Longimicrobiaceae bacterium]|nr:Gfo/Idh/MocA family oxidoreductase [Longimicrobiaceae bacterium]